MMTWFHLASRNHGAEFADVGVHLVSPPFLNLAVVLTQKMTTVCSSLLSTMVRVLVIDQDKIFFASAIF